MTENIKNLLVDFGGVLVGLDHKKCISSFEAIGIKNIDKLIDTYFQEGIFGKHEKGLISDEEFRNKLRMESLASVSDNDIDNAWNSFLTGVPQYKIDFLKQAKNTKRIFLLSNTNNIHWQYSLKNIFNSNGNHLEDIFDKTYLSYKLKMVKPDSKIFRYVLEDADIRPEETLFIDDSEINCQAASRLGIKTYKASANEDWTTKI